MSSDSSSPRDSELDEFKRIYLDQCSLLGICPLPELLKLFKEVSKGLETFERIALKNCKLNDWDIKPLLAALKNNTTIRDLTLSNNCIADLYAFERLLEENKTIEGLDLSDNPFSESSALRFAKFLREKTDVKWFTLNQRIDKSDQPLHIDDISDSKIGSSKRLEERIRQNVNKSSPYNSEPKGTSETTPSKNTFSSSMPIRAMSLVHGPHHHSRTSGKLFSFSTSSRRLFDDENNQDKFPKKSDFVSSPKQENTKPKKKTMLMSRVEWMLKMKEIFHALLIEFDESIFNKSFIIQKIKENESSFPLIDKDTYESEHLDKGYSVKQVIIAIEENDEDFLRYDDVVAIISSIGKKKKLLEDISLLPAASPQRQNHFRTQSTDRSRDFLSRDSKFNRNSSQPFMRHFDRDANFVECSFSIDNPDYRGHSSNALLKPINLNFNTLEKPPAGVLSSESKKRVILYSSFRLEDGRESGSGNPTGDSGIFTQHSWFKNQGDTVGKIGSTETELPSYELVHSKDKSPKGHPINIQEMHSAMKTDKSLSDICSLKTYKEAWTQCENEEPREKNRKSVTNTPSRKSQSRSVITPISKHSFHDHSMSKSFNQTDLKISPAKNRSNQSSVSPNRRSLTHSATTPISKHSAYDGFSPAKSLTQTDIKTSSPLKKQTSKKSLATSTKKTPTKKSPAKTGRSPAKNSASKSPNRLSSSGAKPAERNSLNRVLGKAGVYTEGDENIEDKYYEPIRKNSLFQESEIPEKTQTHTEGTIESAPAWEMLGNTRETLGPEQSKELQTVTNEVEVKREHEAVREILRNQYLQSDSESDYYPRPVPHQHNPSDYETQKTGHFYGQSERKTNKPPELRELEKLLDELRGVIEQNEANNEEMEALEHIPGFKVHYIGGKPIASFSYDALEGIQTLPVSNNVFINMIQHVEIIRITSIPNLQPDLPAIWHQNIRALNLSGNNLMSINFMAHLPHLEFLNLNYNSLFEIPNLACASTLKELYLSHNKLSHLSNIPHITNLTLLELSFNHINSYETLSNLCLNNKLIILNLVGNPITQKSQYVKTIKSILPQVSGLDIYEQELSDFKLYGDVCFSCGIVAVKKRATPSKTLVRPFQTPGDSLNQSTITYKGLNEGWRTGSYLSSIGEKRSLDNIRFDDFSLMEEQSTALRPENIGKVNRPHILEHSGVKKPALKVVTGSHERMKTMPVAMKEVDKNLRKSISRVRGDHKLSKQPSTASIVQVDISKKNKESKENLHKRFGSAISLHGKNKATPLSSLNTSGSESYANLYANRGSRKGSQHSGKIEESISSPHHRYFGGRLDEELRTIKETGKPTLSRKSSFKKH